MQRMRNLYTLPDSEFTAENQWLEDEVSFWSPASFQGHSLLVLPLKFSMEPENQALEKEILFLENHHFQGYFHPTYPFISFIFGH